MKRYNYAVPPRPGCTSSWLLQTDNLVTGTVSSVSQRRSRK